MPRAVEWEPGRATCGACKSKLHDLLVHVRHVRCDVLSIERKWIVVRGCSKMHLWRGFFSCVHTIHMMGVWISVMQGLYA